MAVLPGTPPHLRRGSVRAIVWEFTKEGVYVRKTMDIDCLMQSTTKCPNNKIDVSEYGNGYNFLGEITSNAPPLWPCYL